MGDGRWLWEVGEAEVNVKEIWDWGFGTSRNEIERFSLGNLWMEAANLVNYVKIGTQGFFCDRNHLGSRTRLKNGRFTVKRHRTTHFGALRRFHDPAL